MGNQWTRFHQCSFNCWCWLNDEIRINVYNGDRSMNHNINTNRNLIQYSKTDSNVNIKSGEQGHEINISSKNEILVI